MSQDHEPFEGPPPGRAHGAEPHTQRLDRSAENSPGSSQSAPTDRIHPGGYPQSTGSEETTRPAMQSPPWPGAAATQSIAPAESDSERTQRIQPVPAGVGAGYPQNGETPGDDRHRGLRRSGIIAGAAAAVLLLIYVGDLIFSGGTVPRGTTVASVEIGGMDKVAAERKLRDVLGPELDKPVELRAGEAVAYLPTDQAGLEMDWAETIEHAGAQPLNPFTRISSLFTTHEVAPVSHGDRGQLTAALEEAAPQLNRKPAEGTIRFEGATPIAVEPIPGRTIDIAGATDVVLAGWVGQGPVNVPFTQQKVSTTKEGVREALEKIAKPAVASPVQVLGEGKDASLEPEAIAAALRFEPDGQGGLKSHVDIPAVVGAVEPQLAETLKPGKDAEIVVEGGAPVVHPSIDGRGIDWNKSFEKLAGVLSKPDHREVRALYVHQPAKFTTDQANQLGVKEVVSEFTTGGFQQESGVNIRVAAGELNGALIKPGETFSLNGHTGPRGTAQGYVESGIIQDGRPQKAVGGGISQLATTLFNASYFAGMKDVEHKEHSYYISRYPEGREATVFQSPSGKSVIDVKFKNVSDYGIMITTAWTPSSVTVKFWSTKQFDVHSQTGPRSEPTEPQVVVVPPGEPCEPSKGQPGFSVHDTRTVKDLKSGQTRTESPTKTVYDPHPIIHCGPPPPPR